MLENDEGLIYDLDVGMPGYTGDVHLPLCRGAICHYLQQIPIDPHNAAVNNTPPRYSMAMSLATQRYGYNVKSHPPCPYMWPHWS